MKLFGREVNGSTIKNIFKNPFTKEIPVGIDITNESIVVVELSPIKGQPGSATLNNLVIVNTPENAVRDGEVIDPSRVAETIRNIWEQHGIKSRKVITAVSGQAAIIRPRIKFPVIPLKELKEVVLHDAERYIPFPIQDVYIDFQVTGTIEEDGTSKYDVLLVTAQKQLIDTYLETFRQAEIQLVSVDVASFSVMRAVREQEEAEIHPDMLSVMVLIRSETTDLNVTRGGVPLFFRSIPLGSSTFIETIASHMEVDLNTAMKLFDQVVIDIAGDEEYADPEIEKASRQIRPLLKDLSNEIQKSIEYFHQSQQENARIQQMTLSDRGAKMKNLDLYLSHSLGLDVEICNPIRFLSFDENRFSLQYLTENATLFATAIGLARRGIDEL
jgi:type IV pilus assembly protein PilM